MSRLLLVRHGNTKGNSAERFWGHTDVALSADGVRQAKRLRDRLAVQKIDAVYTSDLCRASRTAEVIASPHRLEVISCFQEISQLYPELARTWLTRSLAFKFPGGESIADLDNRVSKFLDRLEKHIAEETVLIVAHSGVLRLLICHLLRIEAWHWRQIRTDLASMSILETYPQATILTRLNDISHLD